MRKCGRTLTACQHCYLDVFLSLRLDHRITKAEVVKWVNKATRGLWTQTGATLEHVLLWWCNTPLACQPVTAAKHLRDWLLNIQYDGKVLRANRLIGKQVSLDSAAIGVAGAFPFATVEFCK